MSSFNSPLLLAGAVLAALAAIALLVWFLRREKRWPYHARVLMTAPEQRLYERLLRALPDHQIHAQVQLSRVLAVDEGHDEREWFNRISRMSLDFVICHPDSSIAAVIELDDASHDLPERQAADAKKDHALASAGVPIVRWTVREMPGVREIRATIPRAKGAGMRPRARD
ncbi:DUF2726 domain-containing protein [Derxia gummosa]|uniref:DUF2726 domain-containing protein n=1 Tax=Derxia gummosa DSM 723 TaxID=1121388 RepID=A0A8B6XAW1_9BURK|nr:DUF2726 domain-containing protein [Derxia gummosa]